MRFFTVLITIFTAAPFLFAQTSTRTFIQPKESIVGVYANQIRQVYEEALFKVSQDDRLLVIDEKGGFYKVQSTDGQTGWVEKRLCIKLGRSKTVKFDNQDVTGYLENPTPIYILDRDDPGAEPMVLNRSFKDAIRENIDEENVKRQVTN